MMNTVTMALKYCFVFLLFFVTPIHALQITSFTSNTLIKEGGILTLKVTFLEEHSDKAGCTVGLGLLSNGTATLGKDFSVIGGDSSGNITVDKDKFTMLYRSTGVPGSSHFVSARLQIKENDGIEPNETISALIREIEGMQRIESVESVGRSCSISNTYVVPTITIIDTDKVVISEVSTSTSNLKNTTCVALRETVATATIQDRSKKDEESIKKLSGDDLSFYKSNCLKGSITRNFETEETLSQSTVLVSSANKQMGNVHTRLDTLRASGGKRGTDFASASINIQGTPIPVGMLGGGAGDDELLSNSRWGFFANGEYGFGSKKRANDLSVGSGDRNFDFNSKGLTLGMDYRFPNEKLISGVALGYKDFDADFITQSGNINTKGYNLSLYGTYLISDKSYVDVLVGTGHDKITSYRPINNDGSGGIGSKKTFAIGKPKAKEFLFSVGGGYEFHKADWTLIPYGRMDYIQGKVDAYTETASHSSAVTSLLAINKQSINSLTSTFGFKATRVISSPKGVFIPHVSLEWKHDFKERGSISGKSSYLGNNDQLNLSPTFEEANKNSLDKDYFNIGVGVSAVFPKGRSAYINLESRLGDSTIKDNAIKAGFRWEF